MRLDLGHIKVLPYANANIPESDKSPKSETFGPRFFLMYMQIFQNLTKVPNLKHLVQMFWLKDT